MLPARSRKWLKLQQKLPSQSSRHKGRARACLAKFELHIGQNLASSERASWRPPARSEIVEQVSKLEQILHSQAGTACGDDEPGVRSCQTGPSHRDPLVVPVLDAEGHPLLPPELLPIGDFELLPKPWVERMRNANPLGRFLSDRCT